MPYEPSPEPTRRPTAAARADARLLAGRWRVHWLRRWNLARPLTDPEVGDIKSALAAGHPVACGLRWPKRPNGADLMDLPLTSDVRDGHSIALVGYSDDPKLPGGGAFVFRNSYGPGWGQDGYARMSYAYVRAYANDALWLELVPHDRNTPVEVFEAETLTSDSADRCRVTPQEMSEFGAPMWSQGRQLLGRAEPGGGVSLVFQVRRAGRYRVVLRATAAPDFGIVRCAIDGEGRGDPFNLYSGCVCPAGELDLGVVGLGAGRHALRVTVTGRDPVSTGSAFGLDRVELLPAG